MDGFRLLHELHLTNVLSYGPKSEPIGLQPLNVLIGPNGSGKSNLIEAISVLKAAPVDITGPIRAGGGIEEWSFKGGPSIEFEIEAVVSYPPGPMPLRYKCRIGQTGQAVRVHREDIEWEDMSSREAAEIGRLYTYENGGGCINTVQSIPRATGAPGPQPVRRQRPLQPESLNPGESVLSQLRDPYAYPELTRLVKGFDEIGLFRDLSLGPWSPLRGAQRADEPASFLREDGKNLGVILSVLWSHSDTRKRFLAELKRFYAAAEDITTRLIAGTVETLVHERGHRTATPTLRLSDGTVRYLYLLCMLCHPSPQALVCIEEPEVGLHPDILPHLAELLVEASRQMQLIVTTHSDVLVSALSDVPEAVVICERDQDGTRLQRLEPARLEEWLKKYSLGELWSMGELGGNP